MSAGQMNEDISSVAYTVSMLHTWQDMVDRAYLLDARSMVAEVFLVNKRWADERKTLFCRMYGRTQ
jgi:hypothetical protein